MLKYYIYKVCFFVKSEIPQLSIEYTIGDESIASGKTL